MNFDCSSVQIQGARSEQQDRLITRFDDAGKLVALVCDGVGGKPDGGLAADVGASAVSHSLIAGLRRPQHLANLVGKAIAEGHKAVEQIDARWSGSPWTTLVGGVFIDRIEAACLFAVGDSCVIHLRSDGPPEILNPRTAGRFLGRNVEQPWILDRELRVGDIYLFASDGIEPFLKYLPNPLLQSTMARELVEFIAKKVLDESLEHQDNITLVVVQVCA